MLTKEELLQKGVSEAVADEIIASAALESKEDPENSLQLLEKALNEGSDTKGQEEPGEEPLAKAKEEKEKKDDSEDEDYDEKYMKKHMPRYMKENKKACGKVAKEAGLYADELKKAIDEVDKNYDGAIMEMADLKPVLEKIPTVIDSMAKAIEDISRAKILFLQKR
jgi:hypothetical protein